jgi:Protein of unknown function (DUF2442)
MTGMWRRFFGTKVIRKQDSADIGAVHCSTRSRQERAHSCGSSQMAFITQGKEVSGIEVINISKHGIWLATRDHELFISFKEFPWFQDASVRKLMNVEQRTPTCLYWPDLDIDLAVEAIRCFPLMLKPSRPTTLSSRRTKTNPATQLKGILRSTPFRTSSKAQSSNLPEPPHFPTTLD